MTLEGFPPILVYFNRKYKVRIGVGIETCASAANKYSGTAHISILTPILT